MGEWIKKVIYTHTYAHVYCICVYVHIYTHLYMHTQYYSATKKKILPFVTWINLEAFMLGKISQTEKDKDCISLVESKKKQQQLVDTENRVVLAIGEEGVVGKWVMVGKRYKLPVLRQVRGCNLQHGDCS